MIDTSYFWFVVGMKPQAWPFYMEVPYAAWPTLDLEYNSDGDCDRPYDRQWSLLDVMNWKTYQEAVVRRATAFGQHSLAETRRKVEQRLEWAGETIISPSDHHTTLTFAPIGRLWLYLLDVIPPEVCTADNAIIGSFRCDSLTEAAAIARLFTRRTGVDEVFDGQMRNAISRRPLQDRYLQGYSPHASDELTDEVHHLMSVGVAWHQAHPEQAVDWWKTLPQSRNLWKGKTVATPSTG